MLKQLVRAATLAAALLAAGAAGAAPVRPDVPAAQLTDAALVRHLPGFRNSEALVNGVRLHYVIGGEGPPLVLLPGWPQTWWSFHKIMPALAKHHTVIAVDLRGMGSSDKPAGGYEKKTMAGDIHELLVELGYTKADIVGHDIGSMVAYSYAARFPQATNKLVLLDVAPPDAGLATWPLLPAAGTFSDRLDEKHAYVWWFAFHQVKGLPEELLEGRSWLLQAWMFRYLMQDESKMDLLDRAVYAAAYDRRDAIRAGDGWYQAFPQDILDNEQYAPITMPVLAIGGPGYEWLKATLANKSTNHQVVKFADSGHFIPDEQPDKLARYLNDFLR
ncbi:pimeloyl-ACP methyl ester carboxylesterase [Duganella sp. 1224]|uniref:alpha/beta fold hydrolase n=1 Tax=Duganella sp. 1224 TaxID=2587052 RepID=UPI0015C8F840|nr:alpha/beta hydrolase [Duganella sp. 1224]NYE62777.1 pimeloyl-ACP methyl ester carboxylesterase [Duganella sp. 1224]